MKATEPGPTIGIALEPYGQEQAAAAKAGVGKVLCFLSLGERHSAQAVRRLTEEHKSLRTDLDALRAELQELKASVAAH